MEPCQISFLNSDQLTAKQIFSAFPNATTKKFGQNFIFDPNINSKIVDSAGDLTDRIVVEIGPGPGGLTLEILKHPIKKLYVVEIDRRWADVWRKLSEKFDGKLEVIEKDALKFDERTVSPQVIISNLPYNVSTLLLTKWLANFDRYEKLVLMFQKEVADRLYAKKSTKSYGKLSVLTQWKSEVEKAFDLDPGCFTPPPKVKSTVVKFYPKIVHEDYKLFSAILNDAFLHRRKLLVKALKQYSENIEQILEGLGHSRLVRAEEISVEDFIKLANILNRQIYLEHPQSDFFEK